MIMMMAMIIMGLVLGSDKMIDSVVVVTECTKAFWWHSMEYSLVIDSDWQQSFPRHMLQWVPCRYLNRWQIFNCWWFITPSTSPPPVIKECTEGSLRITCPSFCLSIISYQSSHYTLLLLLKRMIGESAIYYHGHRIHSGPIMYRIIMVMVSLSSPFGVNILIDFDWSFSSL